MPLQSGTTLGPYPVWSSDGCELLYLEAVRGAGTFPATVVSAPVDNGSQLTLGAPHRIFNVPQYRARGAGRRHDVGPDGRLLIVSARDVAGEAAELPRINLALNWFQELTERVPVN